MSVLAFSPGGDRLVSFEDYGLVLWDPKGMKRLASVDFDKGSPPLTVVFPNEEFVLALARDGLVWRWALGAPRPEHLAALDELAAAAFSADGSHLVIAREDGEVRAGPSGGAGIWVTVGEAPGVSSVAISADGSTVMAGTRGGEIKVWPLRTPKHSRPASGSDWLSDRPTIDDSFGRRPLAEALARRLDRISAEADGGSFLLHLDGPWGAGKSSLLRMLEAELEGEEAEADKSWLVVPFDAWRQSGVGPPWWALLTALRESLGDERGRWGRFGLRGHEFLRLTRGYLLSSVLSLVLVGVAIALFLVLGTAEGDVGSIAQTISAVIAVATTVWLLARGAARAMMWESAGGAKLYEQADQNPMRGLVDQFAWLIARAGDKRVIFFLDDLDRCREDYVVELLESIQTLVRDAPERAGQEREGRPPFFVVAADGRWIRRSYEHSYETFADAVHEPGRRLGYLFLDKIFQLTVRVPAIGPDQQKRYFDELLGMPLVLDEAPEPDARVDAVEGEARIRGTVDQEEILRVVEEAEPAARRQLQQVAVERLNQSEVEEATEHELQRFAALLESNPRSMKRFVNAYSVALSTQLIAGRLPDTGALALWTILRMRWPDLADCLAGAPRLVTAIAANGDRPPTDLPDPLHPLCDDEALKKLLAFDDAALSAEKVEAMT